jgi:hypothetical protein
MASPQNFTDLFNGTTTIDVPANTTALILARFTAESACIGGTGYCSVRILIDGSEAQPAVGNDFAFDGPPGAPSARSVERYATGAGPGTHTVTVQVLTTDPATVLSLDDWTLVVEAIRT